MAITTIPETLIPKIYNGSAYLDSTTLDAAEEHIALVMRVPKTGTLKKLGWYINSLSSPNLTATVALETVAEAVGNPVATSISGRTLYAANAEGTEAFAGSGSTGIRYTDINGSTGISVNRGDLVAFTVRLSAHTSGSITVARNIGGMSGMSIEGGYYGITYLGGTLAGVANYTHQVAFVYDDSINFSDAGLLSTVTTISFNNGSNPNRRGIKFKFSHKIRAKGIAFYLDLDTNVDAVLYDSDEYTVLSSVTLDSDQRRITSSGYFVMLFGSDITFEADTWYRFALYPNSGTTSISIFAFTPADSGALTGLSAMPMGANCVLTTFNGTPSSGSHSWSDGSTSTLLFSFIVNGIEAGGGGGLLVHPGMCGGMNG